MQHTLKDAGSHQQLVSIQMCIVFSKQNVQKNWYRDVSGCVFRTFAWQNPQKNFDVNIALSKCEFIGVAAFERTKLGIQKSVFSHIFVSICRSYLQKCNTFKVCCRPNSIGTLKKSSTFKGNCVVNAENLICDFQTGPLINMIFKGQQTILKERTFQQFTATKGLVFVRQPL